MNPNEELKKKVMNMLRVSDYMLERVVMQVLSKGAVEKADWLLYDIMAECQCRNEDGTLTGLKEDL